MTPDETMPPGLASAPVEGGAWTEDMERERREVDYERGFRHGKEAALQAQGESPPREPTRTMMDAGLYHSSDDATWADIYTVWTQMHDTWLRDGRDGVNSLTSVSDQAQGEPVAWRCFHCDDVFRSRWAARQHFGLSEDAEPACRIAGANGGLLEAMRRAEADAAEAWALIHAESTEAEKSYRALAGRHEQQNRAAEQAGYDRAIADAKAHPEELGLTHPPASADGWRPIYPMIDELGCSPVIVRRVHPKGSYGPAIAFIDVTGVWRVAASPGGMALLLWTPTHYLPLTILPEPPRPAAEGGA